MGKRKHTKEVEAKKKKLRADRDSELSQELFSAVSNGGVDKKTQDVWEDEEQDYELKPRLIKQERDYVELLPIKTHEGKVERVLRKVDVASEAENDSSEDEESREEVSMTDQLAEGEHEDSSSSPEEKLIKIKEEIADLASKLIEDPEENVSCFSRLRKMSESKNLVTSQLAIMALIPIFKSLAPSYRIRPLTDSEKKEKVSRDVARLRQFEQSLVHNYCLYVDYLASLAKVSNLNSQNKKNIAYEDIKKGELASKAACELALSSLRHFNHRSELISVVTRRLNKKPHNESDLEVFKMCLRTLETLLKDDEENGDITFDVVRIMTKIIRDKKFRVDESVINVFLSLTLLRDYMPTESHKGEHQEKKLKKKERIHLSKKERMVRKENKIIEEEMRKAEQAITVEQREKYQAQVLKMLLTLYLEILKAGSHTSSNPNNDATLLMASVLEGLSRFGQMANFDLIGDFLEVLREIMLDIINEHSLAINSNIDAGQGGIYNGFQARTVLLCIATAFSLVTNHASVGKLPIAIDLSEFVSSLYVVLADLSLDCDLEFSHKTLRLADPLALSLSIEKPSVNVATKSELLLRCLDFIFFRSKNSTISRALSFTKRLNLFMLQTSEKTSLATLKFIGKLATRYGESIKGLWDTEERISGEGNYFLGIERIEREVTLDGSKSESATLWENVLLERHYSPMVSDGSRSLMKSSKVGRTT